MTPFFPAVKPEPTTYPLIMRNLILSALLMLSTVPGFAADGTARWSVQFSPKGGCTDAVIAELGKTKETVLIQACSFTSALIAAALVDAHKRRVKVQVILDKSERGEKYSSADFVAHAHASLGVSSARHARTASTQNRLAVLWSSVLVSRLNDSISSGERGPVT